MLKYKSIKIGDYETINDAIDNTEPNTIILLDDGIYKMNKVLDFKILFDKNITILGNDIAMWEEGHILKKGR